MLTEPENQEEIKLEYFFFYRYYYDWTKWREFYMDVASRSVTAGRPADRPHRGNDHRRFHVIEAKKKKMENSSADVDPYSTCNKDKNMTFELFFG